MLARRVVDDQIGVRSRSDDALDAGQPEHPRWRGGTDLHPALPGQPTTDHATVVEQIDPILDARQPVGHLPEIADAELLLVVEIERAVVGRDHLQVVLDQARPEVGLVIGRSQRR